jgi:arylsulfatase A-like enzyme
VSNSPPRREESWLRPLYITTLGATLIGIVTAMDEIFANQYGTDYGMTILKLFRREILTYISYLLPVAILLNIAKHFFPRAISRNTLTTVFASFKIRALFYLAPLTFFVLGRPHFGSKRLLLVCGALLVILWIVGRLARAKRTAELAALLPVGIVVPLLWFDLNLARTQAELFHIDAFVTVLTLFITAIVCIGVFVDRPRTPKSRFSLPVFRTYQRLPVVTLATFLLALIIAPYFITTPAQSNPKNVILIGIDTLRADHTTLHIDDPARDLTPNLRALAQRGTLYENAISQSPWTMPAFASIMTGQYPHEHGAISLYGKLPRPVLTLPEVFREAGYNTAAAISHLFVDERRGFAQGFDHFDESAVLGEKAITSQQLTDAALNYLEKNGDDPFFLFLHYFDPHYEYRDHEPWDFADAYTGPLTQNPDQMDIETLRAKRSDFAPQDTQYLRDLYDEEIAYTDKQLGRLLDHLKETGLDQNTAIILVSDHGEEFMERGWLGHTISLHEEVIHVPMLTVLPGTDQQPTRNTDVTETRALFNIITNWAGLPQSSSPAPENNDAYSIVWLPDAKPESGKQVQKSALRRGDHKLIFDHRENTAFLYNLKDDPEEKHNLVEERPELRTPLEESLTQWVSEMTKQDIAPTLQLKDEELESLKSLGYL